MKKIMTMAEAYAVGTEKLNLRKDLLDKCREVATEMGVKPQDAGPMVLAIALMGVAKATKAEDLSGELTDALSLVARAESEWRMDMKARSLQ